jgi:hypothetical protein
MKFKAFLKECSCMDEPGTTMPGFPVEQMNEQLSEVLGDTVLSPQAAVIRLRNVAYDHGFEIPLLYRLDPVGDEVVFDVTKGTEPTGWYAYMIYNVSDNGYEVYAEFADSDKLQELLLDDGDTTEYN